MKTLTPIERDKPSANPASGDVTTIPPSASASMGRYAPLIFVSRVATFDLDGPSRCRFWLDDCFFVTEGQPRVPAAASRRARVFSPVEPIDVTPWTRPGFRDAWSGATKVRITVKEGAA